MATKQDLADFKAEMAQLDGNWEARWDQIRVQMSQMESRTDARMSQMETRMVCRGVAGFSGELGALTAIMGSLG